MDFPTRQMNTNRLTFGFVMKLSRLFIYGIWGVVFPGTGMLAATNTVVMSPPIYVPSLAQASVLLPNGVLAWDGESKETNVSANAAVAGFVFNFTNVSSGPIVILNVRPSCGCTTAKLPPLPWTLAPGTNGQMIATVNLAGKSGTLYKSLNVYTDKGFKTLLLKITILPFVMPKISEADRAQNVKIAVTDRQAVFKGDCATCHMQQGEGKYGQTLYEADCAICHEGERRATMVPDLHALKTPTNFEFWRIWIAHGKPGSLMPAFSTADGGPLSDMQIASLASYLGGWPSAH
jgi:mono/diheme cytochrome c family protein